MACRMRAAPMCSTPFSSKAWSSASPASLSRHPLAAQPFWHSSSSMASPDNEPAPVLLHSARGQFVLLHPITWEAVELRADRAPWQLARDADGRLLLRDSAGDPSPVERYFAQHLVFSDNSEAQVHSASGAPMSLAEFRSLHVVRYCRLEVPILPACSIISHIDAKLLCMANGECGCRILWEFRRLQRFLFPESDYYQSARWPQNRWPRLVELAAELAVPPSHFQRPRPTAQSCSRNTHGISDDFSLSTFGLVASLVRWCGGCRRDPMGGGHLQMRARSLLNWLVMRSSSTCPWTSRRRCDLVFQSLGGIASR